ncbi:metalloregulator ArsR/SmtB family transcription factor [Cytobacillus horneckiae]|uniref:Transcriptional regulator n=1 Tax=Cytobacillus horneckiae TaxID=549687 RepID=A0A2N0ZDC8_9BACI|nr:metalloregulator ArsR/SmtB family transcription factor [Cytobacillus horneckiae]NRG43850.1 helix-turn-helix transcriptional regulator [Bacillus sp. CRN 9]MBN6885434.1 helix-turn-helix transcriptional regulator [Cytobacillus horneckiae]MCM3178840.1 metalloregulator ArsR/SmtB family transcription factor [Cytobacillus horneckiae]MEC1158752.1 metalloregulator ArsR/SmtB family transcription factor [Cytobacillus horneckiae]MED2937275.1 metalloregulator ArsR/SmtB family transcription factor [Cytob
MVQKLKKENDVCETFCYDEEKVNRVQPRIDEVSGLEQLFKALSDATRIKIAYALTIEEELCVCDVANIIGSSTATASHHLRLLKNIGLAKFRKEGKLAFYSLDDEHVKQLIQVAYTHHKEGVRT